MPDRGQQVSGYTPTTEEVRKAWADWVTTDWLATEQFDRWLAEVKAQAWEEGYDDGYVDGSCDRERADNPYRQGENNE